MVLKEFVVQIVKLNTLAATTEGIFRISGNVRRITEIYKSFEQGSRQNYQFSLKLFRRPLSRGD